ncbi:RNA-directed DNA polymerase from mobile element jockey [Plakobranchus ocellatus]|uniref:RNA-directed DNA polymerase from mobile element jockey n=1 Tax=Plakobranchus ocellatus TaxID=259542 RepID=A0AAV3YZ81_9GAST|nr:RNA-directed DNA polymerase from mobile element jockey [Plakobranchus ocellatus]
MLEEFIAENDFIILNSGEQTFFHSACHSTSANDLAMASPFIATECSWAIHSDLCGSDQFPIFLNLMSSFSPNVNTTSFNFQKADWNRFGDLCKLSLDDSVADIKQFTSKLLDAAKSSIPFHKGTKNKIRVPWFTQEYHSKATRLRDGASVFSAELEGKALSLTEIKKLTKYHKNFVTDSDSLSALQAIQSRNFRVIDIRRLYNLIRKFSPYVHISFVWIPAHVGIRGNENVDKLAKAALNRASCSGMLICYSDLKPKINSYINSVWQKNLDAEGANKLHEVLPNLGEDLHRRGDGGGRKQETAMCRLRNFAIFTEGKHLQHLERTIQLCINNVQKWIYENGFRFSVSKTTCVHFHGQPICIEPALHLDGQLIPAKFLGVVFDTKLNFTSHVKYLKKKCLKALHSLRRGPYGLECH